MRAVIARFVTLLVITSGISLLLQVGDAPDTGAMTGVAAPFASYPSDERVAGDGGLYATHRAIVPFGRSVLQLPILMYHYIRTPPSPRRDLIGYNLSTAPTVFTAQMDWLFDHGYHTVTFNDVRQYWKRVQPLPSKPVIITLDDGYKDLYTTAFPILQAHNFTAVAYIVSGFVGTKGYVTAGQVKEMDQYRIEIGAHTVNHSDLARASLPWLTYQLVQSKRWLESFLGHPVLDMAYPSGQYNQHAVSAVSSAGYYSATTEVDGILHSQSDRYIWTRVRVWGGEPLSMFSSNLGPFMPTVTVTEYKKAPVRLAMLMQT